MLNNDSFCDEIDEEVVSVEEEYLHVNKKNNNVGCKVKMNLIKRAGKTS